MATTRTFQDMLNDHLNYDLLKEETIKRVYVLQKAEIDNDWKGGTLPVPFKGRNASSISFGSLTATSDIGKAKYVRGEISTQPELWGSMIWDHKDLMQHDGKVNEKSFLKLLAEETIPDFLDYVKNAASITMLSASYFASAIANGDASGNLTVDRPERFDIGQKVTIDDGDSSPTTAYVNTIDINTGVVNFVTTRDGAVAADLSGYSVASSTRCYYDGAQSNAFTSLKSSLLSAANGGSDTLYGQTKTAYPYLQAINVSGASITAANIVSKVFDAYTTVLKLAKGGTKKEAVMSWKHLGSVMKALESGKGAFNIVPGSQKVTVYGWTEITVMGVAGPLTIVGIQEMDDDVILIMDWSAVKIHSNGFFRKRIGPDGLSYYTVRETTGYSYVQDVCFMGDLVLNKPSRCGIIYGISY
jgi:hypothetical protein